MSYTITEIADLIRYHLVLGEADEHRVRANLTRLAELINEMTPGTCVPQSIQWLSCDTCGCSVDTAVFAEGGSNFTADGGFYCSDCIPGTHGGLESCV